MLEEMQTQVKARFTLVVRHAHGTIALVVGNTSPEGAVDGDLQVVGSQPMSMRVRVGEEATLGRSKAEHDDTAGTVRRGVHTQLVF